MRFNVKLHQIRVCRSHQHLPPVKIRVLISHDQIRLQRFNDIGILGVGLGQNAAVIDIHVRFGDVAHRDQALKHPVLPNGRDGHHIVLLHNLPGHLQGNASRHAFGLADLDVLYLGSHVLHQLGLLHAKVIQHKLGFSVHMSGPARNVLVAGHKPLQIGITDGRADRIRIRIPMTDDRRLSFQFLSHPSLLLFL